MSDDNRTIICLQCGAENYSWRSRCQTCDALLHEEDNNLNNVKFYSPDSLKLMALISGVISAAILVIYTLLSSTFAPESNAELVAWFLIIGTGLLALCNVVIIWKWPLIGGILLIIVGLVPISILVWSTLKTHSFFDFSLIFSLFPGLLSLASGIIFLFNCRKKKINNKQQ